MANRNPNYEILFISVSFTRIEIVASSMCVFGYADTYFVQGHSAAHKSDADAVKMLEYIIDNIFLEFGGRIFQQTNGISMGTNCALLLANLFSHSYESDIHVDDVISLKSVSNSSAHVNSKLTKLLS